MGARKKTTAKKKTTSRAMPKTLGAAIDAYSDLRDERLELSRRVDEMKEREALHRQNCIKLLRKAKLTKGSGVKATCSIKADAAFSGRHRQHIAHRVQSGHALLYHGEYFDCLIAGKEMIAVAIGEFAVASLIKLWHEVGQCIMHAQPDDMSRVCNARYRQVQIRTGGLNTCRNVTGGIHQSTVPVKYQKIKFLWVGHEQVSALRIN